MTMAITFIDFGITIGDDGHHPFHLPEYEEIRDGLVRRHKYISGHDDLDYSPGTERGIMIDMLAGSIYMCMAAVSEDRRSRGAPVCDGDCRLCRDTQSEKVG